MTELRWILFLSAVLALWAPATSDAGLPCSVPYDRSAARPIGPGCVAGEDQSELANLFRPPDPGVVISRNASTFGPSNPNASGPSDPLSDTGEYGLPPVAGAHSPGTRTWVEFLHSSIDSNQDAARYNGRAVGWVSGLEYRLPSGLTLATSFAREDLDVDGPATLGGNFDGKGHTVAPYLSMEFAEHWRATVVGGYSWLKYNFRGQSDNARGKRLFGSGAVTANYAWQGMRVAPELHLWYAQQAIDGYTNALAARVPGTRSNFGRASFGGELGYPIEWLTSVVEPYVRVMAQLDFGDDDRVTLSTGETFSRDDFGLLAGLGLNLRLGSRVSGRLEWTHDSIGRNDLQVWTARGRLEISF